MTTWPLAHIERWFLRIGVFLLPQATFVFKRTPGISAVRPGRRLQLGKVAQASALRG